MYNKVLKVCSYDTSTPLLPEKALFRHYMAHKFRDHSQSSEHSSKTRATLDKNLTVRHVCPSYASLKIKSKVRSLAFNSSGSRLYIATRDSVYLYNTHSMVLEHSLQVKTTTLIAHPKHPDLFAILLQGNSNLKPCVKVMEVKYKDSKGHKAEILTNTVISSAFTENWYTGCWSLDGRYLALVDRDDALQVVNFDNITKSDGENEVFELREEDAVRLDSEAYGTIFTEDRLVIHRVDGHLQFFSLDLRQSFVERAHSHIVTASAFDANRRLLATGGSDHVVNLFDVARGMACVGTFPRLEGQVSSLSFSSDGSLLAWGTKDSAPCPLDDGANLELSLESGSAEGEERASSQFFLTVAGVDPCEIYYQLGTLSPVAHVAFSPSKCVVAYACDYDSFPKGAKNSHNNLVGFLFIQF